MDPQPEKIMVKHVANRRIAPLTQVDVPPGIIMSDCENNPALLIEVLKQCDGDVDRFIQQFTTRAHEAKLGVLIKALSILNREENDKYRVEWDEIVTAFKQAKFLLAENAAVKFIGDYAPPKGRDKAKVKITDFVTYSRLWLTQHLETEKIRGRKTGNAIPEGPKEAEGGGAPASILSGLHEAQGAEDNE